MTRLAYKALSISFVTDERCSREQGADSSEAGEPATRGAEPHLQEAVRPRATRLRCYWYVHYKLAFARGFTWVLPGENYPMFNSRALLNFTEIDSA